MSHKIFFITLGCRLNSADEALLRGRLAAGGFDVAESAGEAEVIVVNSCAVTAEAGRKSRQTVRHLRRGSPGAVIVVTGCAAEAGEREFFIDDGADLVLANPEKRSIVDAVEKFLRNRTAPSAPGKFSRDAARQSFREGAAADFSSRCRAFVKIQEGCENFCSYCIVPLVRGPERSRDSAEVLDECRRAVAAGVPEIVLTGVNVCNYRDGGMSLRGLVHEIGAIGGDFRIRLSSTEPAMGSREVIAIASEEARVCRFLHLALQHGSDRILALMRRKYRAGEYAEFAAEAKRSIAGLHLGTDVIVGFPGESEKDFLESYELIKSVGFANLHIFAYSPRPGTPAAELPGRVEPAEVRRRCDTLNALADEMRADFARSQYGAMLPVIFERVRDGVMRGWSDNYLELRAPEGMYPLKKIVDVPAGADNCSPGHGV